MRRKSGELNRPVIVSKILQLMPRPHGPPDQEGDGGSTKERSSTETDSQ